MQTLDKLVSIISWQASRFSQVALFLIMLLIVGDIVLRNFWKHVPGKVEMVELLGVILLGLGVAYCQQKRGHIAVGVLVRRFPLRLQAVIDSFTSLLAVVFTCLLSYQLFIYGTRMLERGYSTGHLGIPMAPFIYLAGAGFLVLVLVLLRDLVSALIVSVKGSEK